MSRFQTISAAITCGLWLLAAGIPAEAATKKKGTTKKGTTKSSAATKKATGEAAATAATGAAASTLDLPLPDKNAAPEIPLPPAQSAEKPKAEPAAKPAPRPNATIEPDSLVEFAAQPPRVQQLLRDAIDLTRLNLTYTFGSADPDAGGMDCSGTIFYLLKAHGFTDVARDSRGQYLWVRKSGGFFPVLSKKEDGPEFNELLPGDVMFWTGTYALKDENSDLPVSHVMLYLGREKEGDRRIMFGASDGRSYHGVPRHGVSIFDFRLPKFDPTKPVGEQPTFVGYARLPGLRTAAQLAEASGEKTKPPADVAAKEVAKPTPAPKKASSTSSKSKKKRK